MSTLERGVPGRPRGPLITRPRKARVALGVLLAVSFVLATIDHRGGESSPLAPARVAAASLVGPVERGVTGLVQPVHDAARTLAWAPDAQRRIRLLEADNARLRDELGELRYTAAKKADLERLTDAVARKEHRLTPANVIAWRGTPGFSEAVEVDVGARDGVRADMTVINADGLVGRVVRTAPYTSTVALLTDRASSAGARVESSSEIGVVHGLGKEAPGGTLLRLQLLDTTADLEPGQRIVSFGSASGRPYVPGVPIGVVTRVVETPGELTRTAYARPYVKFTALDTVAVVTR